MQRNSPTDGRGSAPVTSKILTTAAAHLRAASRAKGTGFGTQRNPEIYHWNCRAGRCRAELSIETVFLVPARSSGRPSEPGQELGLLGLELRLAQDAAPVQV